MLGAPLLKFFAAAAYALLLMTTPAHAGFIAAAVSGVVGWLAGGGFFARIVGSILLSALSYALSGKPKTPANIRNLQYPDSLPPYRFVYGHYRVYGSPAPWRVKKKALYGCLILNSRPSYGNFKLYLDDRFVDLAGDPYDFSGGGAQATNSPFGTTTKKVSSVDANGSWVLEENFDSYVRVWIGRGDQTSPPQFILDEAPELFESTDGWQGLTVIWLKLLAGPSKTRSDRWPSVPPEVTVEGDYSLVYDPRDPSQDPDDESTWRWSNNHALCVLDALRTNPIAKYQMKNLLLDTFKHGANVSDETVDLKSGGTERRWTANGVLIFSESEIEELIQPLALSGAADVIRSGGKLGLSSAAWKIPSYTLTDILADDAFEFVRWQEGQDLPTTLRTKYISTYRNYESAELDPWEIPGARAADGGIEKTTDINLEFCTSPTQAMRVQKIVGLKSRLQKELTGTFPPDAVNVLTGATITVDLPSPYSVFNDLYEVQAIDPGASIRETGEDDNAGVAMRCPAIVRQTSADVYDWDKSEEQDIVVEEFDPDTDSLSPPSGLNALSDSTTTLNGVRRLKFWFTESTSDSTERYEWDHAASDTVISSEPAVWTSGADIDADLAASDGTVTQYLSPVTVGDYYHLRIRAVKSSTKVSDWTYIFNVPVQS